MTFEIHEPQLVQLTQKDIACFSFPEPQRALTKLNLILKQVQCKEHKLVWKKVCDVAQKEFKYLEHAHVCTTCEAIFLRRAQ